MNTIDRLDAEMLMKNSLVCCGLDPDIGKMPDEITKRKVSDDKKIEEFVKEIVDITEPYVCCYKPHKAFYDILPSTDTLKNVVNYIKKKSSAPIIMDMKVGDIGNTFALYLRNIFDNIGADGIVVNPYMGSDVFSFCKDYSDKAFVFLVRTSNSGGSVVQDARLDNGETVWKHILKVAMSKWNESGNLIPLLAANSELEYRNVRKIVPERTPIIILGYGAQGGNLSQLKKLLNSKKSGVIVNSSRGILYPYEKDDPDWRLKVLQAVEKMRDDINTARA